MNFSFNLLLKITLLLLVVGGCTQPDKGENHGSTFYVTDVQSERVELRVIEQQSGWVVPRTAVYTVKACLQDRATQDKIRGHQFQIQDERGAVFEALSATDAAGCFRWKEEFPYNVFASKTYLVPFSREIVGTGVYSGSRTIQCAINPWSIGELARDRGPQFVFVHDGSKQRDEIPKDKTVSLENAYDALGGRCVPSSKSDGSSTCLGESEYLERENAKIEMMRNGASPNSLTQDDAARLWVNDVSLKSIRRRTLADGVTMDILMSMKPIMMLRDTDGNIITKSISRGKFRINAYLVVTDTGVEETSKMIITDSSGIGGVARIDLGELTTQLRAKWTQRAHTGNVTLALEVIPDGITGIEPFEGLFELGNLNSLTGNSSGKILPTCGHPTDWSEEANSASKEQNNFNSSDRPCHKVKDFVNSATNFEELVKQGYASSNEPYVMDVLKLRFMAVLSGETATQRNVLYSASTCITDRFTGIRMADIPFIIEYLDDNGNVIPHEIEVEKLKRMEKVDKDGRTVLDMDGEPVTELVPFEEKDKNGIVKPKETIQLYERKKVTNSVGCLIWNGTIHHAYYGAEEFKWHKVRIRTEKGGADFKTKGFSKIKEFALNPWDDKFTFGFDKEEFSAEFLKAKKAKSRFFLPSYAYNTVRFLYNIDPYMELEVKKTVLINLKPRVLRYAGIVNARKQTEPLRDGIYLLKVAIQKDFLDPTERAIDLGGSAVGATLKSDVRPSPSLGNQEVPSVILESLGEVTPREYITTDTSLVRVVDGQLIHPIELTMRDLRLMRVRSNFLIQLEAVDERAIQAHGVLSGLLKEEIEDLTRRRQDLEERRKAAQTKAEADPEAYEKDLMAWEADRDHAQSRFRNALKNLREMLLTQPFINNSFKIEWDVLGPLRENLEVNDFTDVKFPTKEEIDLNVFIEPGAELEKRTFVGPVIFLSNAYSDSVRATDNLDEARCDQIKGAGGQKRYIERTADDQELDQLGLDISMLWENEGAEGEAPLKDLRQNTAYRYSRYYGALTHLCETHVDDLIERQKDSEKRYLEIMPLASSKANMARTFGLDYVSLSDQSLDELPPDQCDKNPTCKNLRSIQFSRKQINDLLGYDFDWRSGYTNTWFKNSPIKGLNKEHLVDYLLPPLNNLNPDKNSNQTVIVSDGLNQPQAKILSCSILSDLSVKRLNQVQKHLGSNAVGRIGNLAYHRPTHTARELFKECLDWQDSYGNAIIVDDKLKVYETGYDYVFRGGLQMNINVGSNTSFSRSTALNGQVGVDAGNIIKAVGTIAGGVIGAVLGPGGSIAGMAGGAALGAWAGSGASSLVQMVRASGSASTGMTNSEGTSVSPGTYLVGQIAKFDVPIEAYDQCRVIKFNGEFLASLPRNLKLSDDMRAYLQKGLMICSSEQRRSPLRVAENYFYFTQHFTEGDMLDQADLYNHPWLLAIRGVRDYGMFLDTMNAQEVPDLYKFWDQASGQPSKISKTWPLDQLAMTYRQQVPSFPGFYSIPGSAEEITSYPLNDRFSMIESDINGEVNCEMERAPTRKPTCPEKISAQQKSPYFH